MDILDDYKQEDKSFKSHVIASGLVTLAMLIFSVIMELAGKHLLGYNNPCKTLHVVFGSFAFGGFIFFLIELLDYIEWKRFLKEVYKELEKKVKNK